MTRPPLPPHIVVQPNGSQILPRPRQPAERATVSTWVAWLCCDADRRRHPEWAAVAAGLHVRRAP